MAPATWKPSTSAPSGLGTGSGAGPWIMADMENGLFSGAGAASTRPTDDQRPVHHRDDRGEANQWAILGGNAQSGSLFTVTAACALGYNPMHKEGAIILGIGGTTARAQRHLLRGVMTTGYPSSQPRPRAGQHRRGRLHHLLGQLVRPTGTIVAGDDASDCVTTTTRAAPSNKVQMWACDGNTGAQNWT